MVDFDTDVKALKTQIASIIGCSLYAESEVKALQNRVTQLEFSCSNQLDFLTQASHDLRAPIGNMRLAIRMLEVALGTLQEGLPNSLGVRSQSALISAVRYLQILDQECDREMDLINNVLDLQRAELSNHPQPEAIHLQMFVPNLVEPFKLRAQEREQVLEVHFDANLPPFVFCRSVLERVGSELLNNACKYTPFGERIILSIRIRNNTLYLHVRNSGVQIPADKLPYIFEKFYRLPGLTGRQNGSGLGLALVKKLVESLGGSISVDSDEVATRFNVQFPIQQQAKEQQEKIQLFCPLPSAS